MGKSTISMAIFNSYVTNYQRVGHLMNFYHINTLKPCPRNATEAAIAGYVPWLSKHKRVVTERSERLDTAMTSFPFVVLPSQTISNY